MKTKIVKVYLIKLLGVFLIFITHVVLARLMGVEQFGIYVYALAWLSLLVLIAKLGFDSSIIRFVSEYRSEKEHALLRSAQKFSLSVVFCISLFLSLLLYGLLTFWFDAENDEYVLFFLILAIPFIALNNIRAAILKGFERVELAEVLDVLFRPLIFILIGYIGITYFEISVDIANVFSLYVISAVVVFFLGAFVLINLNKNILYEGNNKGEYKIWLYTSLPLFLSSGMYVIQSQADIIMLGLIGDGSELGVYGAVTKLSGLVIFGLAAANSVLAPLIVRLYTSGDCKELQLTILKVARMLQLYSLVVLIIFTLLGEWMLGLFGAGFLIGYLPLMICVAGRVVDAVVGPVGQIVAMTGHQKYGAKVMFISTLVNILLNASLIPFFGMTGAAIATALSVLLWNIALLLYVRNKLKMDTLGLPFMN